MCGWREMDSGLCLKLSLQKHRILVPLQSLALEILLPVAAHFAVSKTDYFYSVAKLHMESEEYLQLICRSVCTTDLQEYVVVC